MPEGESKLARNVLLVAAVAAPTGVYAFLHDHRVIAGIGSESLVFGAAFVVKVWDKLETQYVDAMARWTGPKLQSLITRYRVRSASAGPARDCRWTLHPPKRSASFSHSRGT